MDINKSVPELEQEVYALQQSAKTMMQNGTPIYMKDYAPTPSNSNISEICEKKYGIDASVRTEDFLRRMLERYGY